MQININLEIAEETKRLTLEGLTFNAALRKAKEEYCYVDQNTSNNSNKTIINQK